MTRIQYASDLHLEMHDNWRYLRSEMLPPKADTLVLAGDIGYLGDDNYSKHPFWDYVSDNFKRCIVIPGNHEFYKGYDLSNLHDGFTHEIRPNVQCVYNKVIRVEDTDLVCSTFWAHVSPLRKLYTERAVNDFRRIMFNGQRLQIEGFNRLHDECVAFVKKAVAESTAPNIVVATHHVPSNILNAPQFKNSPCNGAFVSEHADFIMDSRINAWIYGHSHRNIIQTIGRTLCVSNQLGYVAAGEHKDFEREAVLASKQ